MFPHSPLRTAEVFRAPGTLRTTATFLALAVQDIPISLLTSEGTIVDAYAVSN